MRPDAAPYRHTQVSIGMLLLAGALVVLAGCIVGYIAHSGAGSAALWLTIQLSSGVAVALVLIFSRLTTTVRDGELRWSFGIGFPSFAVSLAEIRAAEHVRTDWWWGTGLRITPRGLLYNVGGNQAVELTLDGRHLLVGSDAPDELIAAIRAASASSRSAQIDAR